MKQNQENIIKSPNTIDNNSSTISTTLKPQDDYSSTKHRHSPQCLNMCIKWKLFANLKHETGTYSYSFAANSLFFKRLEASILNILQNNYVNNNERSPTKNCLRAFANDSAMQLSINSNSNTNTNPNSNTNTDNSTVKTDNQNLLRDYLNIHFPIDNTEFNFLILDSNLGIADNLNNIFFLEFDLNAPNKSNSKESLKIMREINDYCVDKEIEFTLNGLLHNVPLFKNDLKFTVEYKKFIKSIQFRIQTYKTQVNNKRRTNQSGYWKGDKKSYYSRNNFFAKILSNFNLGIEFTKPSNEGYENYHTNFNSIVNSNIQISKLYLEVSIPKMFINNTINLSSMVSNDNSTNHNKAMKDKANANESSTSSNSGQSSANNTTPIISTNFITITPSNSISNSNVNNNQTSFTLASTFDYSSKMDMNEDGISNISTIPPSIPLQNDFNRMLFKQQNSPTMTIRNNLSMNSKYHRNFYGSPLVVKPMTNMVYSPPGYINPMIPPQFIPGIPTVSTPMNINQPPMHQPLLFQGGHRKFSEQLYDKLRENPLSKMTRPFNHTPLIPYNPDQMIPSVPMMNKFISPSDIHKIPFNFPSSSMYIPINPMIQTISQKIIDWENISNNTTDEQKIQTKKEYKNQFIKENEGVSNMSLFIKAATFHIIKHQIEAYRKMDLLRFFCDFTHSSLFGLEVSYYLNNSINQCIYTNTLSSFELIITSKEDVDRIKSNLVQTKYLFAKDMTDDENDDHFNYGYYKEIEPDHQNPNLKVKVSKREIVIEYYESRLPHVRYIFIKQIEQIMKIIHKAIGPISLKDLDQNSWFSILWSPIKSMKMAFLSSSFLTYYRFNSNDPNSNSNDEANKEIPLIGMLPIKLNNTLFLSKVSSNNFIGPCGVLNTDNPMMIKQISDNVLNTIIKNKTRTSSDYDYYLKNINQIMK